MPNLTRPLNLHTRNHIFITSNHGRVAHRVAPSARPHGRKNEHHARLCRLPPARANQVAPNTNVEMGPDMYGAGELCRGQPWHLLTSPDPHRGGDEGCRCGPWGSAEFGCMGAYVVARALQVGKHKRIGHDGAQSTNSAQFWWNAKQQLWLVSCQRWVDRDPPSAGPVPNMLCRSLQKNWV